LLKRPNEGGSADTHLTHIAAVQLAVTGITN